MILTKTNVISWLPVRPLPQGCLLHRHQMLAQLNRRLRQHLKEQIG